MTVRDFYFNTNHASIVWSTNPQNMVDGDTASYAEETVFLTTNQHLCIGNSCTQTSNEESIISVKLRAFRRVSATAAISLSLAPRFDSANGALYNLSLSTSGSWSAYVDITTDTSAPAFWTWADVQTLKCYCIASGIAQVYCSRIDIQVTSFRGPSIQDGTTSRTISLTATSPLRISLSSSVNHIKLVSTTDSSASNIRFFDGTATKALVYQT